MTSESPKPLRPPYPRRYITPFGFEPGEEPGKEYSRFGSPLLGAAGETPRKARTRIFCILWVLLSGAHLSGAIACLLIISSIVPSDRVFRPDVAVLTWEAVPAFIGIAYAIGITSSFLYINHALKWFVEERVPPPPGTITVGAMAHRGRDLRFPLWTG